MRALGQVSRQQARVYFTGGVTAVLMGWRDMTIDIDLRFDPELDELYRALPILKERLEINIELAAPSDFIPPLPGWEARSLHIAREGRLDFYHYDPYSQALSKIERGHTQDLGDVDAMMREGLCSRLKLLSLFESIEPQLYKYPAVDPRSFAEAVHRITDQE
ncbi:MAG: DUF6036 family nucleotidyltransferase [Pyrinomonadaceae bacterium]